MSNEPIDVTPVSDVTSDDRIWVVLCFLFTPIFPVVTYFLEEKKARPFIKYHNMPTLIFGVAEAILIGILQLIPVVACIIPFIWILNIVYALKANKGNKVDIPVITAFSQGQNWS